MEISGDFVTQIRQNGQKIKNEKLPKSKNP